jgi:hypothetical protein
MKGTKMNKMCLMLGVMAMTASACLATPLFSDDFTDPATSLPNWTLTTGTLADVSFNSGIVTLQPADQVAIESVQKWTTPGMYQMDFTVMKIHAIAGARRPIIAMPGGISVGFMDWGNGTSIYYKGAWVGDVPAGPWNEWLDYSIVLDGRDLQVYRNGSLELSQTMDSDPDFTTYDDISVWMPHGYFWTDGTNYAYDFVSFDNITLVPEPATLAMLTLGGLAMLRRNRK